MYERLKNKIYRILYYYDNLSDFNHHFKKKYYESIKKFINDSRLINLDF